MHQDIEAKFILIAFANPRSKIFRDHALMSIGLDPTLISRFALIVKTDPLSENERKELFRKRFFSAPELAGLSSYFDQWVTLARLHKPQHKVSQSAIEAYIEKLNEIVENYAETPLRRDLRMADYARRIPMSLARAEFTDVTDDVVDRSFEILERSVEQWG
jgi:Mg-chelatase subunit ChlI